MNRNWIGAAVVMVIGLTSGRAMAARLPADDARAAARLTASADKALENADVVKAIADAEKAVTLAPAEAGARMLLGRAYLAAGRFASAEAALGDALVLDPLLDRAAILLVFAQIANGHQTAATDTLAARADDFPKSEAGLALALLGNRIAAYDMLLAATRAPDADARSRQNLAFVLALDGRWVDAAAIAAQDVPADQIAGRLRRWAMITQLGDNPAMQVGALLGVLPVDDAGQPAALALVAPQSRLAVVDSPAPAPVPLSAAPEQIISVTVAVAPITLDLPVIDSGEPTQAAVPAELAVASASPIAAAIPAPTRLVPVATPAAARAQVGPARSRPSREAANEGDAVQAKPAPAVRLIAAVKPVETMSIVPAVAIQPKARAMGGKWTVQLGAYSSAWRTSAAWTRISARATFLSSYAPTGSNLRRGGATLHRLSVGGLSSRVEALRLCKKIAAAGVACFIRRDAGDQPMRWATRSGDDQPV